MDQNEFIAECSRQFKLNNIAYTDEQLLKLYALTVRMLEVNKSLNLTAIKDEKSVILKHYVDSLTICSYIPSNSTVIDVGCGAGFPTLPLAIFRPDLSITALDGTAKRINYVAETAKLLGLTNVTAVAKRAEDLGNDVKYREKFDIVTARAVAALPVLCELCLPLCKIGGKMIAMKSVLADDELDASKNCIEICGARTSAAIPHDLSADGVEIERRKIIILDKIKKTPNNYPRHYSKIAKKPL